VLLSRYSQAFSDLVFIQGQSVDFVFAEGLLCFNVPNTPKSSHKRNTSNTQTLKVKHTSKQAGIHGAMYIKPNGKGSRSFHG
jgi:hypothetical protein